MLQRHRRVTLTLTLPLTLTLALIQHGLLLVPPQSMVELMQMLDGASEQLEQLGTLAAKATGEVLAEAEAARKAAVASGEEPPPLE